MFRALNEEDATALDAGKPITAKAEGGTIAEQVAGKPTKYISAGTKEGARGYLNPANGMVEIDVSRAVAGGAGHVEHGNVIDGIKRGGLRSKPRDLANATAAGEELFKGYIPTNAIVQWIYREAGGTGR